MIRLIDKGKFRLYIDIFGKRMLYLGRQGYLWSQTPVGQLLTFSKHPHRMSHVLSYGNYKLYSVKDEPRLTDLEHLELNVGRGRWQGYLLLTGLPSAKKIRSKIIPTFEETAKLKSPKIKMATV